MRLAFSLDYFDKRYVPKNGFVISDDEILVSYHQMKPKLPVMWKYNLSFIEWGSRFGYSKLPKSGFISLKSFNEGKFLDLKPSLCMIPCSRAEVKGSWYKIKEGIEGVVLYDEKNRPHVYMLVENSSHYYNVMTKSRWMPVFRGERI